MNIFLSSFTGPFEVCIYILEEISVKPWLLRFSAFSTRSTPFFHILAKSILYPFNLKKNWLNTDDPSVYDDEQTEDSPSMEFHQNLIEETVQSQDEPAPRTEPGAAPNRPLSRNFKKTANYNALLLATRDTIQFYNPFSNFRHYILCLIFAYRGISFIFRNYLIIHVSFFSGKPLKSALIHELCIIFCII